VRYVIYLSRAVCLFKREAPVRVLSGLQLDPDITQQSAGEAKRRRGESEAGPHHLQQKIPPAPDDFHDGLMDLLFSPVDPYSVAYVI